MLPSQPSARPHRSQSARFFSLLFASHGLSPLPSPSQPRGTTRGTLEGGEASLIRLPLTATTKGGALGSLKVSESQHDPWWSESVGRTSKPLETPWETIPDEERFLRTPTASAYTTLTYPTRNPSESQGSSDAPKQGPRETRVAGFEGPSPPRVLDVDPRERRECVGR